MNALKGFLLVSVIFNSCVVGPNSTVTNPDVSAEFNGGSEALVKFLKENFSWKQEQKTVEGIVHVKFVIEKDGSVSNAVINKGLCPSCDKHAIELIMKMPKWIPAYHHGRPVRSEVVLPVKYSLTGS